MESYTYPTSVLPVLRVCTPVAKLAHPAKVGFLAVQGDAIGGSLLESRSITFDVRIQPSNRCQRHQWLCCPGIPDGRRRRSGGDEGSRRSTSR